MGTHFYVLKGINTAGETCGEMEWGLRNCNYIEENLLEKNIEFGFGAWCRESIVLELIAICNVLQNNKHNEHILFGLRMYGEQYTTVSELISKYAIDNKLQIEEAWEIISEILTKVTGLSVKVNSGTLTSQEQERLRFSADFRFTFLESNGTYSIVENLGYVTLFFDGLAFKKARTPVLISYIGALLKEPFLISEILNGEIYDSNSLSYSLLKLSAKRAYKRPSGYFSYKLASTTRMVRSKEDSERIVKEIQAGFISDDGSDWVSILCLAILTPDLHRNFHVWRRTSGSPEFTGPVTFLIRNAHKNKFTTFKKLLSVNKIYKLLKALISKRSDDNPFNSRLKILLKHIL